MDAEHSHRSDRRDNQRKRQEREEKVIEQAMALAIFSAVMLTMLTVTAIAERYLPEKWWTKLMKPLEERDGEIHYKTKTI